MQNLRSQIDAVDTKIHDLLMARSDLVRQVGLMKEKDDGAVFYCPEREAQIHRRLEQRHRGPLPVAALHRIFREIISASLNLEKPLHIVYLGPETSSAHRATLKQFGSAFSTQAVCSIHEAFDAVEAGSAEFGVVPVEDSTEGVVRHTLDRFVDSPLQICAEILLPVVNDLHEIRFLVVGRQNPEISGHDKTSLMFSFRDQPGFLHKILGVFANRGINLTRIESRPSRRKAWDYIFFVDFENHRNDPEVIESLEALMEIPGVFAKILGSYPRAVI